MNSAKKRFLNFTGKKTNINYNNMLLKVHQYFNEKWSLYNLKYTFLKFLAHIKIKNIKVKS